MRTELILLTLTLVAIWRTHHLREWHHAYLGLLVSLGGIVWGPWGTWTGIVITADDCAEHWCEWLKPSPLHWVFATLATHLPFLATVSRWLDGLFRGASSSAPPAGTPGA